MRTFRSSSPKSLPVLIGATLIGTYLSVGSDATVGGSSVTQGVAVQAQFDAVIDRGPGANTAFIAPSGDRFDRRVLSDRFNRAVKDARRRERLRRGLTGEEVNGASTRRRSRREGKRQKQQRGRRRAQTSGVADGLIISGLSPGFFQEDGIFWCAGIQEARPPPGQPLGLRDCIERITADGRDPENLTQAFEIYWDIFVENTRKLTASLPFVPGCEGENCTSAIPDYEHYMEIQKQRRNKEVRINERDDYNPEQLWDFRPGPGQNIDDTTAELDRFNDRTWRPTFQLGKRNFCVEPILTNGTTLEEFNHMRLRKCSNKQPKRERQIWIYCFEGEICDTDEVDPPRFTVDISCVEADTDELACDREYSNQKLRNGEAVDEGLWEDLGECNRDPDRDNKFGKSLVYRLPENRKDDDEGIGVTVTYGDGDDDGTCDDDDANAILRMYRETSRGEWECLFIGSTECGNTDGEKIVGQISENDDRDYLVIVSSDGTDVDDDNDLQDFHLDVICRENLADVNSGLNLGSRTNDGYCFQDSGELNVEDDDDDLPNNFDSLRTACTFEEDVFDGGTLQSTVLTVDTRGIESRIIVRSLCDTEDAEEFELQTLVRIYEIVENSNDDVIEYLCVDSDELICEEEDEEESFESQDLDGDRRYLVVVTGQIETEDCTDAEFDCR